MKKINFKADVWPHILAVLVFLLVTIFFFRPIFFENKAIDQNDITQFLWGSKELRDYRAATGEEGLWSNSMFSGMPAYLVNLDWSDGVISGMKRVLSLFLPHPITNIFLAFVCYYILLLVFKIRPYLAIAGALAFGLSSYMIIGLSAGHNARIGAIAFMPLVMAGIHLAFTNRRILGFGVTAAGLALHMRESHAQITYYLLIIVGAYGLIQLVEVIRDKGVKDLIKTLCVLSIAALLAVATYLGPLWAITEYSKYSTRGKSDLVTTSSDTYGSGLPKSYAFAYSNGLFEPITALVPNFYGGSSSQALVNDQDSKTYQALTQSRDENLANQLAQYTSPYWGAQPLSAPYYAGSIIVFLFVAGILLAERKYVWWLVSVSVFAIMLSWGSNFEAFNYFLFDYLPGYNKFRSVTFAMVIVFFSMPLLGMLGLERTLQSELTKDIKRKLLIAFGVTGGACLLFFVSADMFSFSRSFEGQLPTWFTNALHADRKSMLRSDAFRSVAFIFSIFILLYLNVPKKISLFGFFAFLSIMVVTDIAVVDSRYFSKEDYQRKRANMNLEVSPSSQDISKDKGVYRVLNLTNFYDARTSNFHNSLGGYHGVRIKRYQELYDSCISLQQEQLINDAQQGTLTLNKFGVFNMLNTRYFQYGTEAGNVISNPYAYGNAWFARKTVSVNSANEELIRVGQISNKETVVIDISRFNTLPFEFDSLSQIILVENKPPFLKYESKSEVNGLAVFSEIFYPKGWHATIDGKEVPILRVNYVLRALEVPAGKHVIEFKFEPLPYIIGDKVTMASSWILLLVVIGCLGLSLKEKKDNRY
ncbi:MAG: YfhO family protein [Bacteroidia bacterium]|nr:YfhO family protein [Bacteroidia bacterium]